MPNIRSISRPAVQACRHFGNILGMQPWMKMLQKKQETHKKETSLPPLKFERPWDRLERREKQRKETKGETIINRFWEALDALAKAGYQRTPIQNKMIKAYLGACQRVIYRNEFEHNVTDILKRLEVTELHQEIFVTAIRRCGKTYGVAMTVAAFMYSIPDVEISIFSTGRRASKKLLQTIKRFVELLPNIENTERSCNVETMWIRGNNGPLDIRIVNSYPSKVQIENS